MNTTKDPLEQQNLLVLLGRVEPAWKLNSIRPDPAVKVFEQRAPPRRAFLDWNQGMVVAVASNGGSGSNRGVPVICRGNFEGTFATITVYAQSAP